MKWLKLDCDFRYDPKIIALGEQIGPTAACAFWPLLLGYIGMHGMPECRITIHENGPHSPGTLKEYFGIYHLKSLFKTLQCAADLQLISPQSWSNLSLIYDESLLNLPVIFWNGREIFIPKMLKRLDDYTRKVRTLSVQCPEKPAVELEEELDIDTEQTSSKVSLHETRVTAYSEDFEEFWKIYPRRVGKQAAWKAWKKNGHPPVAVLIAKLQILIVSEDWTKEHGRFIPHPATWLNRGGWDDELSAASQLSTSTTNRKESHAERIARKNRETAEYFADPTGNRPSGGTFAGTGFFVLPRPKGSN